MKKLFLLFTFLMAIIVANAQPLAGIKTIGAGGDYVDVPTAVTALLTNGVNGNLTFRIKTQATAYTVSNMNITTFTGHGLFNVVFESESGNVNDVRIENIGSDFYIFHCYGADNIQFRNISFKSNSTTWSNIFMLDYDADNITIENCKLTGNYNGSFDSQYSLIFVDDVIAGNNSNCDNLIVRNCLLDAGKVGITVNGNSSGGGNIRNQGMIIENDSIVNQREGGINFSYCSAFSVKNVFIKPTSIASPTSMFAGIDLAYCDGQYAIENNQIFINYANPVGSLYGVYIAYSNNATLTNASNFGTLKNNMIHLNGGGPGADAIALMIQDCNLTRIVHNTMRTTADGGEDYVVKFNSSSNISLLNNIMHVGTIPMIFNKDGATSITSDYNVYYGFNGIGTNDNGSTFFTTLANWQASTGLDLNSIFKEVIFFGNYSTLELAAVSVADASIRVPVLSYVTQDIYGKPRLTPTCAGAYERHGLMSGTYYIDNTAPFPTPARTFRSFNKANQALASGVSGAVIFEVKENTTYVEQFEIKPILGVNATNTVEFISPVAQTALLSYTSATFMDNYVVRLDSANNITFTNLSISNGAVAGFGKIFDVINGSNSIKIQGCVMYGNQNPGSVFGDAAMVFASSIPPHSDVENIEISSNTMYYGDYGVYVYGDASLANGWKINNNSFNAQTTCAIYANSVIDAEIRNNYISGISSFVGENYRGIECAACERNLRIEKNQINITAFTSSLTYENVGILINGLTASTTLANQGIIANNMIRVKNNTTFKAEGIILANTGFKKVYYNTILCDAVGTDAVPFYVTGLLDSVYVLNNIFRNHSNGSAFAADNVSKINHFNYNNFASNGGSLSTINSIQQFTLSALQTATGNKNLNSVLDTVVFVDPYGSPNNLHLTTPSVTNANLKAQAISGITEDLDGEIRNGVTPFMGADEGCQAALTLSPTVASSATVCAGLPILTAGTNYGGTLRWYLTASGGVGTTTPPGGLTGINTIYVSEKLGHCETPRTPFVVDYQSAAVFFGSVSVNTIPVSVGKVYLFRQNIVNNRMDTIAIETLSSSNYSFINLPAGSYLVYFKPDAVANPNTPGTYNSDTTLWAGAPLITIACSSTNNIDINATSLSTFTGPGSISGKVQRGVGFGKTDAVGDPIPGVDISLEQNPGGIMVAQTQSDANGLYSFTNLPLADYRVRVSIPGTPHSAYYDVTIDAASPDKPDLIYVVDSNSIYPLSVNFGLANKNNEENIKVIPNPFNNQTTIVLPGDWNSPVTLTITDITGKQVACYTDIKNKSITVKRNNLQKGIYFATIQNNERMQTQKIIVVD